MANNSWHARQQFVRMTSWFDHDFIADDFETDLNHELDFEEKDGANTVKADMPNH